MIPRAFAVAAFIFASAATEAAGWSNPVLVTATFTEGTSDLIVIHTDQAGALTPGCLVDRWTFLADSEARRGRAYATILAAASSGQRIRLWYNDVCGTWGYHQAASVMLVP